MGIRYTSTMIRLTQKLTFRLTLKTLMYEKEPGIAHTAAKSQISTAMITAKRVARLPLPKTIRYEDDLIALFADAYILSHVIA